MSVISKDAFVKAMNDIKKMWGYQEDLNNFFKSHGVDGYIFQPDCTDTVVKVLHEMWGAADSQNLISYFLYDLEFGANWTQGAISDWYGNDLKLQTPEDLYDALYEISQEQEGAVEASKGEHK